MINILSCCQSKLVKLRYLTIYLLDAFVAQKLAIDFNPSVVNIPADLQNFMSVKILLV